MADPQAVTELFTLRRESWGELAELDLGDLPGGVPADALRARVASGAAELCGMYLGPARVGSVVLQVDRDHAGVWLVVAAMGARARGQDLTGAALEALAPMARRAGCVGLRCWTVRPGLARKLERAGACVRYVAEMEV